MSAALALSISEARLHARRTGDFTALIAAIPYSHWIGVRIEAVAEQLHFVLPFQPLLTGNPKLPALHGGVVAGFLESAGVLQLLMVADETRVPKSIDFSIDYLRSAQCIDTRAVCTVTRLGRRVAQVQIRCWQDDITRTVAVARAHFLLSTSSPAEPGTLP